MSGLNLSPSRSPRWFLATAFTITLLGLIPLVWHPRFYFQDDTENGAYGVWYHLGESLLHGQVPILNPNVWSAGNYAAEGQWGTWNPLIMAIGVAVYWAGNAVVMSSILKIAMLVVGGLGCYMLARSFNVSPALSYIAGVAAPMNGFTLFFDAPSWVTGLLAWSLVPIFWLELKRMLTGRRNPFWAFVVGYLIVTIGYVAGTVAVGFVLLAVGVDSLLRRQWGRSVRIASVGLGLVLIAVVVYLPGVLTAAVTNRSGFLIANDNFMSVNLSGLAMSTIATAFPMMLSWWWPSPTAPAPALYIAWFLPLVAFLSWRKVRSFAPTIRDILFFGSMSVMFVLLPTTMGPLRYPARFMPYVALAVILLSVVLFAHARSEKPSKLALFGATAGIAFGVYCGWAQYPDRFRIIFATGVAAALGIAAIWLALRKGQVRHWRWGMAAFIALVVGTMTVATTAVQQYSTHGSPLSVANVPADTSIAKNVLAGVTGDVLVVGDPLDYPQDESTWSRTLMANTWYLSPASVQNRYQLIGYKGYFGTMCMRYLGGTCAELLPKLFEIQPETSMTLADELGVDNIQILKKTFDGGHGPTIENNFQQRSWPLEIPAVPAGWHQVSDDGSIALWSRDVPTLATGGLVWSSEGTRATEVERTDTQVRVKIDKVPATGGKIAFSRLAWPGYSASGATLGVPVDGFLLSADVPSSAEGSIVTVKFVPPGWSVGIPLWILGVGGVLVWSVVSYVGALRRRRHTVPQNTLTV